MSKLGKFAAACVAVVCGFTASASPLQQCELVVSGYAGTTELVDFPLLVRISPTKVADFNYADCATGGADISFADAEGNALPHEVDTWTPDGASLVWVKVPRLKSAQTSLTLHWGDAQARKMADASDRVWDGFTGVWHMGRGRPRQVRFRKRCGTAFWSSGECGNAAADDGDCGWCRRWCTGEPDLA